MKKISFVLIALLALVAFTGCPTAHKDAEWSILTPGYVIGIFNSWSGQEIEWVKKAGVATAQIEFTAANPNANENANNPFGVCSDTSWTTKYTGAVIVCDGDWATLTQGAADNNTILGLTEGNKYIMYLESDASTIKVKVASK